MLCSVFLPFCAKACHRVQFSISVRKAAKILCLALHAKVQIKESEKVHLLNQL